MKDMQKFIKIHLLKNRCVHQWASSEVKGTIVDNIIDRLNTALMFPRNKERFVSWLEK